MPKKNQEKLKKKLLDRLRFITDCASLLQNAQFPGGAFKVVHGVMEQLDEDFTELSEQVGKLNVVYDVQSRDWKEKPEAKTDGTETTN